MKRSLSRRRLIQGGVAMAGAAALGRVLRPGDAHAQAADKPAVLLVFLKGGYNALFSSADSFVSAGTFGVTASNVKALGNGLVVDNATFGTNLPNVAQSAMAAIGVNHGISAHQPARTADWTNGSRSYALMLANAMGGPAAIKCAVLGSEFPDGPRPAEGSVSMQQITDLSSTIRALGGDDDPAAPNRAIGAAALTSARTMSGAGLTGSPVTLKSVTEAYNAAIDTLNAPGQTFDFGAIANAYGVSPTNTVVGDFRSQMLAAEVMILAGANVVIAVSPQWDSHGDTDGSRVRQKMNNLILPGLRVFLQRMMNATGRNVTTAIFGDFARSLPGSDHARVLSATVIGKRVRVGTTGRVTGNVGLPAGSPSVPGLWSYLAAASRASTNPFGANPHSALLLP